MDGEPVRLGPWGYQRAPTQLSDCTTKANLKCTLSLDAGEDNFWQPRHPSAVMYAAFLDDTVLLSVTFRGHLLQVKGTGIPDKGFKPPHKKASENNYRAFFENKMESCGNLSKERGLVKKEMWKLPS